MIRRLKDQGMAVVLISHNLEHVYDVADRIVVLRQGVVRGECDREHLNGDRVVSWITGSSDFQGQPAPRFG